MKPMRHLLSMLGLLVATPCFAAPTISIQPAANVVFAGQEFEVAIEANAEFGALSCFAFAIDYDPSLLEIVSSSEGSLFVAAVEPTYFQQEQGPPGQDVFTDCVLGFGTSVLSPGELFRIRFKALTSGNSNIDIVLAQLRDLDRALIGGVTVVNGSASISLTAIPPWDGRSTFRLMTTPNPSGGAVLFQLRSTETSTKDDVGLLQSGSLEIFDAAGRRVRDVELIAEGDGVRWNARDRRGHRLASGIYFALLRRGGDVLAHSKLLLVD
jgi:hypothetical protein